MQVEALSDGSSRQYSDAPDVEGGDWGSRQLGGGTKQAGQQLILTHAVLRLQRRHLLWCQPELSFQDAQQRLRLGLPRVGQIH